MRLTEFASAEDTLVLWKMISDNTWAAIAQQAEAEAKRNAERAAARKTASKRGTGKRASKPFPPKRLPPPLQHVTAPVPKDAAPAPAVPKALIAAPATPQQAKANQSNPAPAAVQMPQISNDLAAANTVTTRTAANTLQPTHAAVKK